MRLALLLAALALAGCAQPAGEPAPRVGPPPGDAIFRAGAILHLEDPTPSPEPEEGSSIARAAFVAGECRTLLAWIALKPDQAPVEAEFRFAYSSDEGAPGGLAATFEPATVRVEPGGRANATMTVCAEAGREGERGHASVGARVEPEVGSVSRGILTRIVAP